MPKTIRNVYDKEVSFEKLLEAHRKARRGKMYKTFKINVYFDEKGEKIENLISRILIDILGKKA